MSNSPEDRASHYRRIAMKTYDLADLADDPVIIGDYLAIASRWLRLAERADREPPPASPQEAN